MINANLRRERLLNLEKVAIERYTDEIDFASDIDMCDVIVRHLVSGDFDNDFISEYLTNDNRENIMNLVNQYSGLCFYDQDYENWADSTSLQDIGDYRAILSVILDNYDFLIRMASNGGRDVLNELTNYVDCAGYNESSVVDYLRVGFNRNDDIIEHILVDMVNNENFSAFSNEQRACMLDHPLGVLFKNDRDEIEYCKPEVIANTIGNYMNPIEFYGNDEYMSNLVDLTNRLKGIPDFEHVIYMMSYEYKNSHNYLNSSEIALAKMLDEETYDLGSEEHKYKLN